MKGEQEGKEVLSHYHGKTSRYLYTRHKEHLAGLEKTKEDNALWKHKELYHKNKEYEFVFSAEKLFKDPCSQAIYEGVRLNHTESKPGYLMNSRY